MPNLSNTAPNVCMFACLSDNYGYLVHHAASNSTICIDSPDPSKILEKANSLGWTITHILNTHWHADHAGGNEKIQKETGCRILGPKEVSSRLNAPLNETLSGGETLEFGDLQIQVLATPGHTLEHISYYIPSHNIAFVGDTLFALGCGRMFEGQPEMFWNSLKTIRALPDETQIYCAHEYTLANLEFALSIDPENTDLKNYGTKLKELRAADKPTIPTNLGMEKLTNPFLRADNPVFANFLGMNRDASENVFAHIRKMKDNF